MEDPNIDEFGFLQRLTLQLTLGAAAFPDELRDRHGQYVLSKQLVDGGWGGREGESDLYYTGFALRTLAVLGLLEGQVAERAAAFLQRQMGSHQGWVDLLSLVYGAQLIQASCEIDCMSEVPPQWEDRLSELLQRLRRPDGGYSKSDEGRAGSTYQTFLVIVCMELLGRTIPDPMLALRFVLDQRQDDGGFLEIRVGKRSGTNPTAAAIASLSCLGALSAGASTDVAAELNRKELDAPMIVEGATEFLLDLQNDDGGFQANTRMPVSDVLSTFTACTTLWELGQLQQVRLDRTANYVRSMERASGGFAGFELDPAEDIEYTFYGLGTLALCQAEG